jgi:hypothetical protein
VAVLFVCVIAMFSGHVSDLTDESLILGLHKYFAIVLNSSTDARARGLFASATWSRQ